MVARLKLKGIDGRAPPGVEPAHGPYSEALALAAYERGNVVIHRGIYQLQGDDNGHVGRHCEVSPAPPCPELFCELRGLCRRSYFGPRTCGRSN